MLPGWYRLRLVATIFFVLVGIGLLFLAFTAPSSVRGESRVLLGMLAIILPIGFYALLTVTGWQRSVAAGAVPPPGIARVLGWSVASYLPLVFMFMLLGMLYQLVNALDGKS